MIRRSVFPALLLTLAATRLAADPIVDGLLPLKPEVRQVIDQSCVMCHGEVINGEKETRDDVDLSTDELVRTTVTNAGKMKLVIQTGKMPHKTKLSRRLRTDEALQQRLTTLRANCDSAGHKDILLEWLKDVVAAKEEEKKKEE